MPFHLFSFFLRLSPTSDSDDVTGEPVIFHRHKDITVCLLHLVLSEPTTNELGEGHTLVFVLAVRHFPLKTHNCGFGTALPQNTCNARLFLRCFCILIPFLTSAGLKMICQECSLCMAALHFHGFTIQSFRLICVSGNSAAQRSTPG